MFLLHVGSVHLQRSINFIYEGRPYHVEFWDHLPNKSLVIVKLRIAKDMIILQTELVQEVHVCYVKIQYLLWLHRMK